MILIDWLKPGSRSLKKMCEPRSDVVQSHMTTSSLSQTKNVLFMLRLRFLWNAELRETLKQSLMAEGL